MTFSTFLKRIASVGLVISLVMAASFGLSARHLKSIDESPENIRATFTAAASAGMTYGLGEYFKLPVEPVSLLDHAKVTGLSMASSKIAQVGIQGQSLSRVMKGAPLDFAVDAVASYGAGKIGANKKVLGKTGHKIAHAGLGAGQGFILSGGKGEKALKGAAAGALASLAELSAEQFHAQGIDLNVSAELGKLTAVLASELSGLDPEIAYRTSTTAVENNFLGCEYPTPEESQAVVEDVGGWWNAPQGEEAIKFKREELRRVNAEVESTCLELRNPNLSVQEKCNLAQRLENLWVYQMNLGKIPETNGDYVGLGIEIAPIGGVLKDTFKSTRVLRDLRKFSKLTRTTEAASEIIPSLIIK